MNVEEHDDAVARIRERRRQRWRWLGLSVAVAASIATLPWQPDPTATAPDASAFSVSAVGHHAFARWLTDVGLHVRVERSRPTRDAGLQHAVLMLAPEPCDTETACHRQTATVRRALELGAAMVVALPRWAVDAEAGRPAFAGQAEALDTLEVAAMLARFIAAATTDMSPTAIEAYVDTRFVEVSWEAEAFRTASDGLFAAVAGEGEWLMPQRGLRLIRRDAPDLEPVVVHASSGDALVAQVRGTRLYLVTDADPFANAWLAEGDDAEFLHWLLVKRLGVAGVILDETVHLHYAPPSLWRELFAMPLLPISLHILVLFGLGLWMALAPRKRALRLPPSLGRGRAALVDASARLLDEGAAAGPSLETYWREAVRDLASGFGLPDTLTHAERVERLAAIAEVRGITTDPRTLETRVATLGRLPRRQRHQRRVLPTARAIHTFREDLRDGHLRNR
jgi:hypothetical protein